MWKIALLKGMHAPPKGCLYSFWESGHTWLRCKKQQGRARNMAALELNAIRTAMENRIGETVELHCYSRRKVSRHVGVLEGAYNAVFTVLVLTEDGPRRMSYTYADVLTKSITIKPADAEENVQNAEKSLPL